MYRGINRLVSFDDLSRAKVAADSAILKAQKVNNGMLIGRKSVSMSGFTHGNIVMMPQSSAFILMPEENESLSAAMYGCNPILTVHFNVVSKGVWPICLHVLAAIRLHKKSTFTL